MKALFWILCALVGYAYIGYPLLLLALARLGGRRHETDSSYLPTVTILIPAYNEEELIEEKIRNTLALDYPSGLREVIVASESSDATDSIAARYAQEPAHRVKLLTSATRRGKSANLHRAVPHAEGDILVFTDANAALRPDALRKLVRSFADPRIGCVSGRLAYRTGGDSASAEAEATYWGYEAVVKRASSALGSLPGANGSLYALRRELYRPIAPDRGDDFELPIRVILAGHDAVLEPEALSQEWASPRYADEYRRKVRIIGGLLPSALILLREAMAARRPLLVLQLLSHKLLRWSLPVVLILLLVVSMALAGEGWVFLAALGIQVLVYALALAGALLDLAGVKPPALLGLPLYFVVVNAAALIGLISGLAGRRVTWHKRVDRSA